MCRVPRSRDTPAQVRAYVLTTRRLLAEIAGRRCVGTSAPGICKRARCRRLRVGRPKDVPAVSHLLAAGHDNKTSNGRPLVLSALSRRNSIVRRPIEPVAPNKRADQESRGSALLARAGPVDVHSDHAQPAQIGDSCPSPAGNGLPTPFAAGSRIRGQIGHTALGRGRATVRGLKPGRARCKPRDRASIVGSTPEIRSLEGRPTARAEKHPSPQGRPGEARPGAPLARRESC